MNEENCLICNRIRKIKDQSNPYFVAELETGYVVVGDHQFFDGYTLFLCKQHQTELHFLDEKFKVKFLNEMAGVAEAVYKAFHPDKLNYEMLGNGCPHMHWHIFPRRESDEIKGPVWWTKDEVMSSDEVRPTDEKLQSLKIKLYSELEKITTIINKGNF